jgi:hypothetical protein
MLRIVRTVQTHQPKVAVEIATEIVNHFTGKHSQKAISVFIDRFTTHGRNLHWHIDFDNLAHFETWQTEIAQDAAYVKLLGKAKDKGAFVENTMHDTVVHDLASAAKLALH